MCRLFLTKGTYTFHQELFTSYVKDFIQGHYLCDLYAVKYFYETIFSFCGDPYVKYWMYAKQH